MDSQRFHLDTLTVLLANCFDDVESLLFEISEISDKGKLHAKWGNCQDPSVHNLRHNHICSVVVTPSTYYNHTRVFVLLAKSKL